MSILLLKRSSTSGNVPTNTDLVAGELALNVTDGKLFYKNSANTVQELLVGASYNLPAGFIVNSLPEFLSSPNWLPCNGAGYAKSSYSNIGDLAFPAIGVGGGSTFSAAYNSLSIGNNNVLAGISNYQYVRYTSLPAASFNVNTWSSSNIGSAQNTVGIAYNAAIGRYCLVTATGTFFYTDDLTVTWTSVPAVTWLSTNFTQGAEDTVANKCCFVTNGQTAAILSPDSTGKCIGKIAKLPVSGNWVDIASNNSIFLSVVSSSTNYATSPDGFTWTLRTLPLSVNWSVVVWNGSVFFIAAQNSDQAATSPDGITWTVRTLPISSAWRYAVRQGSRIAIASSNSTAGAYSDDDGVTWTSFTTPGSCTGFEYSPKLNLYFFGVSGTVYSSADLIVWVSRQAATTILGISWHNDFLIVSRSSNSHLTYSGLTAADYLGISGTTANNRCISTGSSVFSLSSNRLCFFDYRSNAWNPKLHQSGLISFFSVYTLTFNTSCNSIYSQNSKFYTLPSNGSCILESDDGITWEKGHILLQSGKWAPIAISDNITLSICANTNKFAYTTTGDNWQLGILPVSSNWQSIGWSGEFFYTASYGSNILLYSYNGLNWYSVTLTISANWKTCTGGNGWGGLYAYNQTPRAWGYKGKFWYANSLSTLSSAFNVGLWLDDHNGFLIIGGSGFAGYIFYYQLTTHFLLPSYPANISGIYSNSTSDVYIKT